LRSVNDGIELFSFVSVSSKSVGRVIFCRADKLGISNWGTEMGLKGLILFKADTALAMAELALEMSFWMDERMEPAVLWTKALS
jgi:hypothetical protein